MAEYPWKRGEMVVGDPAPGGAPGTAPASLAPEGAIMVALPGFNYPPPGSLAVESVNQVTVQGGTNSNFEELVAFDVDIAEQFRIWEIGFSAVDPTALVFSEYRVLKNKVPLNGYDGVPLPIGTLDRSGQVALQVAGPARLSIEVRCLLPGSVYPWVIFGRIHGWRFNDPRTR